MVSIASNYEMNDLYDTCVSWRIGRQLVTVSQKVYKTVMF